MKAYVFAASQVTIIIFSFALATHRVGWATDVHLKLHTQHMLR